MILFLKILFNNGWVWFFLTLLAMPSVVMITGGKQDGLPAKAALIITLIILCLIGKSLFVQIYNAIYLARKGVIVTAVIIGVGKSFKGASDLYYKFDFEGEKYRGTGTYSDMSVGDEIKLLVDPNNPQIHMKI